MRKAQICRFRLLQRNNCRQASCDLGHWGLAYIHDNLLLLCQHTKNSWWSFFSNNVPKLIRITKKFEENNFRCINKTMQLLRLIFKSRTFHKSRLPKMSSTLYVVIYMVGSTSPPKNIPPGKLSTRKRYRQYFSAYKFPPKLSRPSFPAPFSIYRLENLPPLPYYFFFPPGCKLVAVKRNLIIGRDIGTWRDVETWREDEAWRE